MNAEADLGRLEALVGDDPGATAFPALAEALRRSGRSKDAERVARAGLLRRPDTAAGRVALALGSGPRLLEAGEVHADTRLDYPGWVNRFARTAVGLNDEHLFLVTTLQAVPRAGLSMERLAEALRSLGCREAINLDGGPSTTLWAGGRVVNLPAELEGSYDEPVATGLFVLPPGQGMPLR